MSSEIIEKAIEIKNTLSNDVPAWASSLILVINEMVAEIKTMTKTIESMALLQDRVNVQERITTALQAENAKLRNRIDNLEESVDNNEQHGRNRNLVLHGLPEVKDENTTKTFVDTINKHLNITITNADIERSHRLGRFSNDRKNRPRPIIARFVDETKKIKLYKVKKGLKGKGVVLSENLTAHRYKLYKKAQDSFGFRNTWTMQGRIFAKDGNGFIEISCELDLPEGPEDTVGNRLQNLFT